MIKTEWALTTWANRATANYVPIDKAIGYVVIDAFGRKQSAAGYNSGAPRRTVKQESGPVAYAVYDSDAAGPVPVIRMTEE